MTNEKDRLTSIVRELSDDELLLLIEDSDRDTWSEESPIRKFINKIYGEEIKTDFILKVLAVQPIFLQELKQRYKILKINFVKYNIKFKL